MESLLLSGDHRGGSLGSWLLPVCGITWDTLLSHSRSIAELRLNHGPGFTEALLGGGVLTMGVMGAGTPQGAFAHPPCVWISRGSLAQGGASGSSSATAVMVPVLGPRVSLGSEEAACLMLSGNDLSKGSSSQSWLRPQTQVRQAPLLLGTILLHCPFSRWPSSVPTPSAGHPAPCPSPPPVAAPSELPAGTSMRPERHLEAEFQHGLPLVASPGQGLSHLILSRCWGRSWPHSSVFRLQEGGSEGV